MLTCYLQSLLMVVALISLMSFTIWVTITKGGLVSKKLSARAAKVLDDNLSLEDTKRLIYRAVVFS